MTDHNGHSDDRHVWVVYHVPELPDPQVPSILRTFPVLANPSECRYCEAIEAVSPCPGAQAHAEMARAKLSVRTGLRSLHVELFSMPPHVSVLMCANHLYGLLVRRIENDHATGDGDTGA
ncbi:hypothetical protein [Amycolatopsis samaneae]|uniref:Uncharacterized protein n=1 Tax=Amycolatopsis samaneae TaxID=664691 RepID=A0ABW5GBY8_9PSEU